MFFRITFSFFLFASISFSFASKKSQKLKNKINQTQSYLSQTRNEISILRAMLNSLNSDLSKKNNMYLNFVRKLEALESKIVVLKSEHQKKFYHFTKIMHEYQKDIQKLMLIEGEAETEEQVLIHAITLNKVQNEYQDLKKIKKKYLASKRAINSFELKIAALRKQEEELLSLVHDLENEKQLTLSKAKIKEDKREKISEKYNDLLARSNEQKRREKALRDMRENALFSLDRLPLNHYDGIQEKKKGVVFKSLIAQSVFAVNKGVVQYSGDLGNFGKIIMINHGKNIRSVYLGNLSLEVKNGQEVKTGEVIGKIKLSSESSNDLYFELRKKEKKLKTKKYLASLLRK